MRHYIIQTIENQPKIPNNGDFWLHFQLSGDGTEWLDANLLTPHYLHHNRFHTGYVIAWAITGYFGTPTAKEFLLDVIARFLLLYPDATRLPWKPELRESGHIYNREPYELKEIASCLPSLPWSHDDTKLAGIMDTGIKQMQKRGIAIHSEDALFEATRWHLYRRAYAERRTDNITEEYVRVLLETENELLPRPKPPSDVRSKAKRMAEYMQTEFVIYDNIRGYKEWSKSERAEYMRKYRNKKEITMATREEHMQKVNENRKVKTRNKIKAVLDDVFLQDQIKTKAGKPKAKAIANILEIDARTVSTHLKEMGLI